MCMYNHVNARAQCRSVLGIYLSLDQIQTVVSESLLVVFSCLVSQGRKESEEETKQVKHGCRTMMERDITSFAASYLCTIITVAV